MKKKNTMVKITLAMNENEGEQGTLSVINVHILFIIG